MPLGPLEIFNSDEEKVISGADWEIDTLEPDECVGVFVDGSDPKIPSNVRCEPTGETIMTERRFWRDDVIVYYNGVEIASCPLEPSKCDFKTKNE